MSRPLLEVVNVSRVHGDGPGAVVALQDMNLTVRTGEVVCLVGASGCGKSTFLGLVAGLDAPTSGRLLLDGVPLVAPGVDRGMVFQSDSLFPWLSVRDNVRFGLTLLETRRTHSGLMDRLHAHCDELLEQVGLWPFREHYPAQLSGGMRQRASIVRALATRPSILLMDEPFGALDAQTREDMQLLLMKLCTEYGTTVLFVTHDVEEAVFLGDRVVVLRPRPGHAVADVAVPIARPRDRRTRLSPEFQAIRGQVLDHLYARTSGT